jgi:hypothetical protein
MAAPTLIYCSNGNRRFAEIALSNGYLYGAQLPGTVYLDPYFVDNKFKDPNREAYMAALAEHRPYMASVIDWMPGIELSEVVSWAEEAACFVDVLMIIPKIQHTVHMIPRSIGEKQVRIGYSVPTRYGGTELMVSEFYGWPVHLLGGSPGAQMKLCQYMNVVSADGNMARLQANRGLWWLPGKGPFTNRWVTFREMGEVVDGDIPYKAFERSCVNMMAAWNRKR